MKKLNKLQINSERLMKNEELIALKGGTNCICWGPYGGVCATGTAGSGEECHGMCINALCGGSYTWTGY
jgi:natural product precursor